MDMFGEMANQAMHAHPRQHVLPRMLAALLNVSAQMVLHQAATYEVMLHPVIGGVLEACCKC